MRDLIRSILKEETSGQTKLIGLINRVGFVGAINAVGGKERFNKILKGVDYLTTIDMVQNLVGYSLEKIREESENWGMGEMEYIDELESVDKIVVDKLIKDRETTVYLTLYVFGTNKVYDNIIYEIEHIIKSEFGLNLSFDVSDIINVNTFGPGIDW